jgi:hypothetical protein
MDAECDRLPLVPVNEIVKGPSAVADETDIDNIAELPALMLIGDEVTPVGRFFGETITVPVKPFFASTESCTDPALPRATCKEVGETDNEKSGVLELVTVTVAPFVTVLPLPEAVRVKMVVAEGETDFEPLIATAPIPLSIETVELEHDQARVELPPVVMLEGLAVNDAQEGSLKGGGGGEPALPPPQPTSESNRSPTATALIGTENGTPNSKVITLRGVSTLAKDVLAKFEIGSSGVLTNTFRSRSLHCDGDR